MKINRHIEIVRSGIRELNYMSRSSCDSIAVVLARQYAHVGITVIRDAADLETLVTRRPDLVFLGAECIPSDPALGMSDPDMLWIAQHLDDAGITFTGSGHIAHRLGRDKALAKQCVLDAGLTTSAYCVIRQGQQIQADVRLTYPLFVKPTSRGGGLGIDSDSVTNNFEQLRAKALSIAAGLQSDALVEEYLEGREFSVAILKHEHGQHYAVMPLELIAPKDIRGARILSSSVKSANTEQAIAVTDEAVRTMVNALALRTFNALGARDYGRIDIRLDRSGTPHFLEANLMPSLISGYGSFPKACALNANLDYESMILRIVYIRAIQDYEIVPVTSTNSIHRPAGVYPHLGTTFEPA